MKIKGTLKELDGKITFNGKIADQPALSVLSRYFGKRIEEIKREGGGRSATVWEFDTELRAEVKLLP